MDREARESQAVFRCRSCGYCGNADVNAARNIAAGHAVTPELPRSSVSPPSEAITVCPAALVGMGTIPYCWLYFQLALLRVGKIHGPSSIIAAFFCTNCWVRSGSWPQLSTDFEAEPFLTIVTKVCTVSWPPCHSSAGPCWVKTPTNSLRSAVVRKAFPCEARTGSR
ncbi:MAG: zinc ribbon domain-containing protein [Gemmatimonadota bacterium]